MFELQLERQLRRCANPGLPKKKKRQQGGEIAPWPTSSLLQFAVGVLLKRNSANGMIAIYYLLSIIVKLSASVYPELDPTPATTVNLQ